MASKADVAALATAISDHATATKLPLSFGKAYSGELSYTMQPQLDGMMFNYSLMKKLMPHLEIVKKPLDVKAAVLQAHDQVTGFTLNNSTFARPLWAGWIQRCVQRLQEHIARCKVQPFKTFIILFF